MHAANSIIYVEFHAGDLERTKAFFTSAFGWTFTDYGPDYTCFSAGAVSGGFARSEKRALQAAGSALVVLFSPKLEETLERVKQSGGTVTQPIFSYPGGRRFHFTEPSGNELSVCTEE